MKATILFAWATVVYGALAAPALDLFVGTQGLGHVSPAAAWPFGMVQAGPDTSKNAERYVADWPHTCGYQFDDRYLWRFSQCRFYGIGCGSMGFFGLLPSARSFDSTNHVYSKEMDKTSEKAVPGYYAVTLKEDAVRCETTVLAHSAAYRFDFGKPGRAYLLVDPGWGCQLCEPRDGVDLKTAGAYFDGFVLDCESRQQTSTRLALHAHSVSWNEIECWGVAELSSPIVSSRRLRTSRFPQGEIVEYAFDLPESGVLEVRLALSRTSIRAAAKNLSAEMPAFDFEGVRTKAAAEWARRLRTLTLDPATPESTKTIFESAFYRTMIHPSDLGDVGSKSAYSNLSLWDIFRACSPLQTIVAPDVTGGLVESMCDIFDRQGYLPILHTWGVDNHCMVGHHAVPIIVDAYLKGIAGFDAERAYEAVKDSLTVMHVKAGNGTWGLLKEDWDVWDAYGYYPFDKLTGEFCGQVVKGESVSRTLECAYNDACAAKFAAALGKKGDAAFFAKRAKNWKNVYDASVGFMRGKDSKGKWREPFDPKSCGAGPWADNDFTEGNAWQYTWHVMHDIPGLVAAMGGKERFGEKLEALFNEKSEVYGPSFTHDVSGLLGQYAHGNEPSHHVAYLFRFSDRPEKTDEYVSRICRKLYKAVPDGCCGNDDSGQLAAWYVFSVMGFYPMDPCGGDYVIGAPQVPGVTVRLPNGKQLEVVARGFSSSNRQVKSVTWCGTKLSDWKFSHADLLKGGKLEFEMVSDVYASVYTNSCLIPRAKLQKDGYDWWERHARILREQRDMDPEIVFVGDSITHFWAGKQSIGGAGLGLEKRWEEAFGKWRTLNLGYGWDRIQNVLWRLQHGEMDGLNPRLIVLHIGTNNVGGTPEARANTPEEIAQGTLEVVRTLERKVPQAKIVVMAIFPREERAGSFWRTVTGKSNAILADLVKDDPRVIYLDIGDRFLDRAGMLSREIMDDFVHPTDRGYSIWADALLPIFNRYCVTAAEEVR